MCVQEKILKDERNFDVGVCPKWLEKVQSVKRSPFKKIDIENKAKEIYLLFQDYIDCPVSVLIQPLKDFPWFFFAANRYSRQRSSSMSFLQ